MSVDKSLKRGSRLVRSRNVLKRAERIDQMKADDRWPDGTSPIGIPKTRVFKIATGKKKKEKKEDDKAAPAKGAAAGAKKK